MRSLFLFPVLVTSTLAFSQTSQSDSQTLKAPLEEVRLLRQEVAYNHGRSATCANRVVPAAAARCCSRTCRGSGGGDTFKADSVTGRAQAFRD